MAKSSKCSYCSRRKGKRTCPALNGSVCTLCCGQHRLTEIECPDDCVYLGHEGYQARRRDDREISEAMHAVSPDVLGYEVLAQGPHASRFALLLEHSFGVNYVHGETGLRDADVLEALRAIYFVVYRGRECDTTNGFARFMVDAVRTRFQPEVEGGLPLETQEQIVLRLMLSVKNIGGGIFGDCGYLNYVKNNILNVEDVPSGCFVSEDVFGHKFLQNTSEPLPPLRARSRGRAPSWPARLA